MLSCINFLGFTHQLTIANQWLCRFGQNCNHFNWLMYSYFSHNNSNNNLIIMNYIIIPGFSVMLVTACGTSTWVYKCHCMSLSVSHWALLKPFCFVHQHFLCLYHEVHRWKCQASCSLFSQLDRFGVFRCYVHPHLLLFFCKQICMGKSMYFEHEMLGVLVLMT